MCDRAGFECIFVNFTLTEVSEGSLDASRGAFPCLGPRKQKLELRAVPKSLARRAAQIAHEQSELLRVPSINRPIIAALVALRADTINQEPKP